VDELINPDQIDHSGLPNPQGLNAVEGFKKFFSGLLTAFPDFKAVIHSQVAEGDKVVTHKTFHGTHRGEFKGIVPTEKKVSFDIIDIFRIADGKMVEHWAVADWMGLMQQLSGASPTGSEKK